MVDKVKLKEKLKAKRIKAAKVIGQMDDPKEPVDYSKKKRKVHLVTKRLDVRDSLDPVDTE